MRTRATAMLAAAMLASLTACGSSTDASEDKPAASQSSDSKPATLDAEQVVKTLTDAVDHARPATIYTADTDPNHLLGRPNGYASKADWTDDRAEPKLEDDAVQQGGSVEVYDDSAAAEERAKFIADTLKDVKILGTEYHYTKGGILLRVSGALTPAQAGEYEQVLDKLRRGSVQRRQRRRPHHVPHLILTCPRITPRPRRGPWVGRLSRPCAREAPA